MTARLRVACAYQGGKQRVASQVVATLKESALGPNTQFFDLCCGSGAVSIELVNQGINPSRISMLDRSSWGVFWDAIGSGTFDLSKFDDLLSQVPTNKREVKAHMTRLSNLPAQENEAEVYPLLQASSFGGKQIWRNKDRWENAFFRNYWEPTATSVRRSPANPMQPSPIELRRRISALAVGMRGVTCLHEDIMTWLDTTIPDDAVVYVDPPYEGTTGYAYGFDLSEFISKFKEKSDASLFVSEGIPLNEESVMLNFGGAKGGITGSKNGRHEEWLSKF